MDHSQFVTHQRIEISAIARDILDGRTTWVEGARAITARRFDADLERDEDIIPFVGIDSETDALPYGEMQSLWKPEALAKLQPEIDKAEAWARTIAAKHCHNLIERFA